MKTKHQIRSFDDLNYVVGCSKKILTLFSGGLDSTYLLKTLAQNGCEVVALTIELGDGVDAADLSSKAKYFGARSIVIDGREKFAKEAVLPALQCNARYMSIYPISASLSRPIISELAVEKARGLGCEAIVHTANQSQNSLRRLNGAIQQKGFQGFYGTPYEFSAISREEKMASLRQLDSGRFVQRFVSGDYNLWCREFESGTLDNPERFHVGEGLFEWTAPNRRAQFADKISVKFIKGVPVAVDGVEMPLVPLIQKLNIHVGAFGVGRYAGLEHLEQGEKVLEVREAPAAHLLMDAYRHLETATLDSEVLREKLALEQVWIREAIEGRWFGTLRTAIDGFIRETVAAVTGIVEYQLRDGSIDVCSIRAERPAYLTDRDNWERAVSLVRGSRSLRSIHQGETNQ